MNFNSIIGLGTVILCLIVAFKTAVGVTIYNYWDPAGVAVVGIGTLGATLLKSSGADFAAAGGLLPKVFGNPMKPTKLIDQLVERTG